MINSKRYEHSIGVMETAVSLAREHGVNPERAALAGLLHDCARGVPADKLLAMAQNSNLAVHKVDLALPVLLHAPVGALLARREFGVEDEAVLRAIALHTLGDGSMTLLDKVVFVADKTEPRRRFPGVDELRREAWRDIDRALLTCYDMSLSYAMRKGDPVHPQMVAARNELLFK